MSVRLILDESYTGEVRDKAPELIKALTRRLGGRTKPVADPDTAKGSAEESTFRAIREMGARIDAIAGKQMDALVRDVIAFVKERD